MEIKHKTGWVSYQYLSSIIETKDMVVSNNLNADHGVIMVCTTNWFFLHLELVFFFIFVCATDKLVIEINDNNFI